MHPDTDLLLLTPGPLSTTESVKRAMCRDISTWDPRYFALTDTVRRRLVELAVEDERARPDYTAVLMQGSGTFAVEATIGSVVPPHGKLLVASNGAYGRRMVEIAARLGIRHTGVHHGETEPVDPRRVSADLRSDPRITHVAVVHCETSTGMLNDVAAVGRVVAEADRCFLVDAMSAFGGIPFDMSMTGVDYLVSSANKCMQGVPGFAFVLARRDRLAGTAGWARSLVLDLHDQWREFETKGGKWRYTSPTQVVLAFQRALEELDAEGGIAARHARYRENQRRLVEGMELLGFRPLLESAHRSPIITSFWEPSDHRFSFVEFFEALRARGFMIYPGKVAEAATFRIGSIGDVSVADIERLLEAVADVVAELVFSP